MWNGRSWTPSTIARPFILLATTCGPFKTNHHLMGRKLGLVATLWSYYLGFLKIKVPLNL